MSIPDNKANRKRVLIITYYWPPSGGPGVQRVLKFAKYLPDYGWDPIILTVKDGDYPATDDSFHLDVDSKITVIRVPSISVLKWYKKIFRIKGGIPTHVLSGPQNNSVLKRLAVWVRINLFLPDARYFWSRAVYSHGLKVVSEYVPDIIFSSSPPHSLQLGVKRLAQKTGIKWIADFRDPWTDGFWLKDMNRMSVSHKIDEYMEHKVLRACDHITTVSPSLKRLFEQKGRQMTTTIYNGYDEVDFVNQKVNPSTELFRIVYTGSLRKSQIPHKFLQAFAALCELLSKNRIQLEFYGSVHPSIHAVCEELEITKYVIFHGYISHAQIVEQLCQANLLLLVIPNKVQNEGILTGKIFEYLGSGIPIIGIGPVHGDAALLLQDYSNCCFYDFDRNIVDELGELYNQLADIETQSYTPPKHYTRKSQTRILSELLSQLTNSSNLSQTNE